MTQGAHGVFTAFLRDVLTEIRLYVFEALMLLVEFHGKVAPTAKEFLPTYGGVARPEPTPRSRHGHSECFQFRLAAFDRIMSKVLDSIARTLLDLVVQIGSFSVAGMQQALLEIEFIQRTLAAYETVHSKDTFQRIYSTLRASTEVDAPPGRGGGVDSDLQELDQLLTENRRATALQFRCFT